MQAESSSPRQWIVYTVLRLAVFGGVFAVLMLLGIDLWLAAIASAVISLCIAYIFIPQPKRAPKPEKAEAHEDAAADDARFEDALVDEALARETAGSEGDRRREAQAE